MFRNVPKPKKLILECYYIIPETFKKILFRLQITPLIPKLLQYRERKIISNQNLLNTTIVFYFKTLTKY